MNRWMGHTAYVLSDAHCDMLDTYSDLKDLEDALSERAVHTHADDEIQELLKYLEDMKSECLGALAAIDEARNYTPEAQADRRACEAAATPKVL